MLKRGLVLLLGCSLLAATGVASGARCCTLLHLAEPAAVSSPDCCDNPDCCREEKRGPAQATLSARAPEAASRAALVAAPPPLSSGAAGAILIAFGEPLILNEHSPPLDGRQTRLLISLFRI